jgi:hypothetical protein
MLRYYQVVDGPSCMLDTPQSLRMLTPQIFDLEKMTAYNTFQEINELTFLPLRCVLREL